MSLPHYTKQELSIYPNNIPKVLINSLIIGCMLLGCAALRSAKGWQGWLNVMENWVFMLLWIPLAVTIFALPFKIRDNSFDLKLAYYLGMFVAFLFELNKLRYWHSM